LIEIGEIVNTHGIKGEVKVIPWADSPEIFDGMDYIMLQGGIRHEIESVGTVKNCALLKLSGVDKIEQAQLLKGKTLYVYRKDLPKLPRGIFYIRDIIGLKVVTADRELGVVHDILQTGANDVYEVKKPDGSMLYIPAIKDCLKEVNIAEGFVLVELLEGLE